MSEKHSIASKKRWSAIPPEKRTEIMRAVGLKRAASMTPEEMKEHSALMNKKKAAKLRKAKK